MLAPMGHLCLQMQQLHCLEVHVSTVSGSTMQTANVAAASMWLLGSAACVASASLESDTDLQPL